jgi:hypothetical protein
MEPKRELICFSCKWWGPRGCEAFDEAGINEQIIAENRHEKVYPEQIKEVTYEPREEA